MSEAMLIRVVAKDVASKGTEYLLRRMTTEERDDGGNTHLMRAALVGQTETVEALLREGSDVDERNREGRTALMFAVINLHTSTVKTLLKFGADVNVQAACGCTPLMLAACSGDSEIVQELLNRGANPRKVCQPGRTALVVALERGYNVIAGLVKRAMVQSAHEREQRSNMGSRENADVPSARMRIKLNSKVERNNKNEQCELLPS